MSTFHTITPIEYRTASYGERLGLQMLTMMLWPLDDDQRMTVLLSALGAQIIETVEAEDQAEALIEVLRTQVKLGLQDAAAAHQLRRT